MKIIFISIIITQFSYSQWSYHGLGDKWVNVLEYNNGYIYASTNDGLYKMSINPTDTMWTKLGLDSKEISSIIVFNDTTIMTSVYVEEGVDDVISLYKTYNNGVNWIPYQHGFGGGESHWVSDMAILDSQTDTIYAIGGTIAKTKNGGLSWEKIYGDHWSLGFFNVVEIDQNRPNNIWVGGEWGIELPFVLRSQDYGNTWDLFSLSDGWADACLSIVIDPHDPDIVYSGMEGRIMKTIDGGKNWDIIFTPEKYHYFHGFVLSRGSILYASGALNHSDPDEHILYKSLNQGNTWEIISHPIKKTRGTNSLIVLEEDDLDILYFGTRYSGVISYTNSISSVEDSFNEYAPYTFSLKQNYPNPFNSETMIPFYIVRSTQANIELYDVLGRKIKTIFDGHVNSGLHITRLSAGNISSGVYYYRLQADSYTETKKLILNR